MIRWYDAQYKLEALKRISGSLVLPMGISVSGSLTCSELSTNALYDNILVDCKNVEDSYQLLHYMMAAGLFMYKKKIHFLYVSDNEDEVTAVAHLSNLGVKSFYTPSISTFNAALDEVYEELCRDDGKHYMVVIMAVRNSIILDDVACTVLAFHQMFNVAGRTHAHFVVVREDATDGTLEKRISVMIDWRCVCMDVENPRRAFVMVNKQPMQITVPWTTTVNISNVATTVYI